jgi:general stress protein 26
MKARRFENRTASIVRACALAMLALLAATDPACAAASERDLAALQKSALIYIATVRKDGNQSKSTPVWFTVTKDGQVLIETSPRSWKAKRIRRGSPAMIWIGKKDGPAFIGNAEIVNDPAVRQQIIEDYPKKYLLARMGFARPTKDKFAAGQIVAIRIAPVRDLPDRFRSAPGTRAPSLDEKAAAASNP